MVLRHTRKAGHFLDFEIGKAVYVLNREIGKRADLLPFATPIGKTIDPLHVQVWKTCDPFYFEIWKAIHDLHLTVKGDAIQAATGGIDGDTLGTHLGSKTPCLDASGDRHDRQCG